jgi:hypothetical protein
LKTEKDISSLLFLIEEAREYHNILFSVS